MQGYEYEGRQSAKNATRRIKGKGGKRLRRWVHFFSQRREGDYRGGVGISRGFKKRKERGLLIGKRRRVAQQRGKITGRMIAREVNGRPNH